jgi:hypothetical protein
MELLTSPTAFGQFEHFNEFHRPSALAQRIGDIAVEET